MRQREIIERVRMGLELCKGVQNALAWARAVTLVAGGGEEEWRLGCAMVTTHF
jgi:hypothetical protein